MKLIKEHITFERGLDPKMAMGVGLKEIIYQKLKELFIQEIKTEHTLHSFYPSASGEYYYFYGPVTAHMINFIVKDHDLEEYFEWPGERDAKTAQQYTVVYKVKSPYVKIFKNIRSLEILKSLRESINFERGLDPKEAMNIGDVAIRNLEKIYKSMRSIAAEFGVEPNEVVKDDQAYLSAFNYNGFVYVMGYNPTDGDMKDWNYSISYEELPDDQTKNKRLEYEQQEYDTLDEAKMQLREWLYYRQQTNESVNFKRGVDPRDAMHTGQKEWRKINKMLDELVQYDGGTKKMTPTKENGDVEAFYYIDHFRRFHIEYDQDLDLPPYKAPPPGVFHQQMYPGDGRCYYTLSYERCTKSGKWSWSQKMQYPSIDYCLKQLTDWLEVYSIDTHQFESINFKRGLDPKDAMQTGDIQKRESDRILKEMRRYMRAAMKLYAPHKQLQSKDYIHPQDSDLNYKSYYYKIDKYQFQLKYYYNRSLWDLELNYYGFKRYIKFEYTTLKDFLKEVRLAMQDLDLR